MDERRQLRKIKSLVVKIGSSTLTDAEGLAKGQMRSLAKQMAALHERGIKIVLVSSGAIAAGFKKMGLKNRPTTLRLKQAAAAVGQLGLMMAWEKAFAAFGISVAQVLLTADDLANRARFLNAKNTLSALLEHKIIPIINENDTVAVEEIKVGDNDTLGAAITSLVEADLFINLTDKLGLFDDNPDKNPAAKLIDKVDKVSRELLEKVQGAAAGSLGTGGMFTKVRAASRLANRGLSSIIASAKERDVLLKILEGEMVGTLFKKTARSLAGKKHWLAYSSRPKGQLVIDAGAAEAVTLRQKSLLPSGICQVTGSFNTGDVVAIVNPADEILALGLSNYSAQDIEKIRGCKSADICARLGFAHTDEVVHRDNLVLTNVPFDRPETSFPLRLKHRR